MSEFIAQIGGGYYRWSNSLGAPPHNHPGWVYVPTPEDVIGIIFLMGVIPCVLTSYSIILPELIKTKKLTILSFLIIPFNPIMGLPLVVFLFAIVALVVKVLINYYA